VPEETRRLIADITSADERVRFFDCPKGPRHGEIYRHRALQHARGRIVCYLSDDDLYLPHHVQEMIELLRDADFAHAAALEIQPDTSFSSWTIDLALPVYQRELLEGRNRIPLSAGAHTLAAYRGLNEGWTSAPLTIATDLHMWQKFLRHPGCRFRAGETPTVLVFPAPLRRHWTPEKRSGELEHWLTRTTDAQGVADLNERVLRQKNRETRELDAKIIGAVYNGGILGPPQDTFQVFFPTPNGYDEQNSARFRVPLQSWQKIAVELPWGQTDFRLRIDPANRPCLIELSCIELLTPDGAVAWRLTEINAHTLEVGGTAIALSRGHIFRLVSDGNDPQVFLPPVDISGGIQPFQMQLRVRLDADFRTFTRMLADHLRVLAG